jgi:hypothetical protein
MRLRLLLASAVVSCTLAAIVIACSDETAATSSPEKDASTSDGRAATDSGIDEEDDAATSGDGGAKDATADAKPVRDANGPGEAGDDCVFNYDCQLALRCECDGTCSCQPGARGTGKNGIDACDAGEHCASSVCVEGPGDSGVHYCSDECATNADCTGMLPKCTAVSFIGKICIRDGG